MKKIVYGLILICICLFGIVSYAETKEAPAIIISDEILATINTIGPEESIDIFESESDVAIWDGVDETEPSIIEETEAIMPYDSITISDDEAYELRWVVALEAGDQDYTGEMAVVEVIFNRVISNKWPNTIHDVLSQKGQFETWKYVGSSKAWNKPGEQEDDAISEVLRNGTSVIVPSNDYVFFATTKQKYHTNPVKIGGHWFGK